MRIKHLHWLDIAEFSCLVAAAISGAIAIATPVSVLPLIFFPAALIFNAINRSRFQSWSRQRLGAASKQLQRLSQAVESWEKPAETAPAPAAGGGEEEVAALKANLGSLEEALENVIEYLQGQVLPERVSQLETAYTQLKQEVLSLANPADPVEAGPVSLPEPRKAAVAAPPTWHCLHVLSQHEEAVAGLAISPDGKFLASASWDRTLKLWEMAAGSLLASEVAHSQGLLAVAFARYGGGLEGCSLATGSFDRTLKLWSLVAAGGGSWAFNLDQTLTAHTGSVHALAFAAERSLLVSGSYDGTIKQWDATTGEMCHSAYDPCGAIYAIALDPERGAIASAGGDGRVSLWELGSGAPLGFLGGNVSSVESLALSPDGQTLAAGCVDGSIKLWQLGGAPSTPIGVLSAAHSGHVKSLAFSPDGQVLYSSGADGTIEIWQPGRDRPIARLDGSEGPRRGTRGILSLALSPDGQWLAAGSTDGTIEIWQKVKEE